MKRHIDLIRSPGSIEPRKTNKNNQTILFSRAKYLIIKECVCPTLLKMSRPMGKPRICIGENKGAFVFATRIVQFLLYLTPKFQASSLLLCLYRPVCVGPVRKPHCWFSHEAAQMDELWTTHRSRPDMSCLVTTWKQNTISGGNIPAGT